MKRLIIGSVLMTVIMTAPCSAIAMSHQDHGQDKAAETGHHGEMNHAEHGDSHTADKGQEGMTADGSMMIVGSMVSKGVKGMAHLKDVSAAMADMGVKKTHHFMIAFINETTGELIDSGTVALKITNPDAVVGDPIPLMGMGGHFGADVSLDMPGEYHFRLGTELADGTKRKYHFHHVVD